MTTFFDAPLPVPAPRHRTRLRDLLLPYWASPEKGVSLLMLAIVLAIAFGGVYLQLWANELLGRFTDALVNKRWDALKGLFAASTAVAIGAGSLVYVRGAVLDRLKLRWRTWMTKRFLDRWTACDAFYAIERDGTLSNADQRISEDVRQFTDQTLEVFVSVLQVTVSAVSFGIVLWRLGGRLDLTPWDVPLVVPGYMLWAAILVSGGALAVTHLTGRPLVRLTHHSETVEANFRHLGVQLRENAEQVAFFMGGAAEATRLRGRFEEVRRTRIALIWRSLKLSLARESYLHLVHPVPQLLALPGYFAGTLSFGQMTRLTGAYGTVSSALSFFYQAYATFAQIAAISRRLRELSDAIAVVEEARDGIVRTPTDAPALASEARLALQTPAGRQLVALDAFAFRPGERWLIRGASGCGKSTFLRALAGLWPYGEGRIRVPPARFMFVPQRSYIPSGTLRAALAYPLPESSFDDASIRAALRDCRLPALADRLDDAERWQQILSGGEQQRLAFARVLLHRTDYVLLDEATSALDHDNESHLYRLLVERLPGSGIVSIAHRESIAAHHTHVLQFAGGSAQAGLLNHA